MKTTSTRLFVPFACCISSTWCFRLNFAEYGARPAFDGWSRLRPSDERSSCGEKEVKRDGHHLRMTTCEWGSSNWPSGSQPRCQRAPWHRFDTQRTDMKGDKCPCTPPGYRKFSSDAIHFSAILTRLSHQDTLVVSRGHITACNADRTSRVGERSGDGTGRQSRVMQAHALRASPLARLGKHNARSTMTACERPFFPATSRSTPNLTIFIFSARSAMAVAIGLRRTTPKCAPVNGAPNHFLRTTWRSFVPRKPIAQSCSRHATRER